MKTRLSLLLASLLLFAGATLHAEDASQPALEAKFKETMTGATMSGQTTALKDGALGASREDKYSIVSVEKGSGSSWTINAQLHGAVVPIPVQVKWAGDTAVIIVDNLQVPGANAYGASSYSARVMIYEHTYAGTWSGGDHGGLLTGVITHSAAK
jgi:hypothetical protein